MTVSELDTFYFKFKNLLLAEKDATLTIKSEEGRAQVTLFVDLGHLLPRAGQQQQPRQGRNGPARMRRRERRAEARRIAAVEEVSETTEKVVESTATQTTELVEFCEEQLVGKDNTAELKVTEEVADEEYDEHSKVIDESTDTISYEIECWDPGNKWIVQDVYNHMGESLEQMFTVFKVKPQDQQYQLDVSEKVKDTFPFKLELKKSPNTEAIIDNFRRYGHVQGGRTVGHLLMA